MVNTDKRRLGRVAEALKELGYAAFCSGPTGAPDYSRFGNMSLVSLF
jgi:hypothetical protein